MLLNAAPAAQLVQVLPASEISLPGLVEEAQTALAERSLVGLDLVLSCCPECHTEWIRTALVVPSGKDFERVKLGGYKLEPAVARRVEAAAKVVVAEAKVAAKAKKS